MGRVNFKIPPAAIEFARRHVESLYDSDFFAKPFEFDALWACWPAVAQYLAATDLADHQVSSPTMMAVPKPKGGFRIVHQLAPLDSLVYAALTYLVGDAVEARRSPIDDRVVFSYRIEISHAGGLFAEHVTAGRAFHAASHEFGQKYQYVMLADISDFYNQVYIHRLQNSLQACEEQHRGVSLAIEQFLIDLSSRSSQGIPVGPAPSIVMAEAVLIDVDDFVINTSTERNFRYIRYVDDFRVFANSREDLEIFLAEFTLYLYRAHRLSLAGGKTMVMTGEEFRTELAGGEVRRKSAIGRDLRSALINVSNIDTGDNSTSSGAPAPPVTSTIGDDLLLIAEQIADLESLDVRLARQLLRSARRRRVRSILPTILNRFDFFLPVMRDVVLYLTTVLNEQAIIHYSAEFDAIAHWSISALPFGRYWVEELFLSNDAFLSLASVKELFATSSIRGQARWAWKKRDATWVRRHKESLSGYGPAERRAIILASEALSQRERDVWLEHVIQIGDFMDRAVARWVKGRRG